MQVSEEVLFSPSYFLNPLAGFVAERIRDYFNEEDPVDLSKDLEALIAEDERTPLGVFFKQYSIPHRARLLLLIALAPHLDADFYDRIIREHIPVAGDFPQFGGARGKNFRGFLPTGETALFLLAGPDYEKRLRMSALFGEDFIFAKKHVLWLENVPEGEPRLSGKIIVSQEYVDLLTTGIVSRPRFGMNFPAQLIQTQLEWEDLVLHADTRKSIDELALWVKHGDTLMNDWGMGKKLKPGYSALFHGPPGTGKTLTATLLGKYTNKDVYRIDLSKVVSKFIGETEKNLSNLFAKAEDKDWILFFDEADALFGKRTNVRDAHDKYANQEVSYLLQRVEQYAGLVILATNFKTNIDEAFTRRFQSIIYFPAPGVEERLLLWQKAFPDTSELGDKVDLRTLAHKYELTGAEIINTVQYACLRALDRGGTVITATDILEGIRKEFRKEGKVMR